MFGMVKSVIFEQQIVQVKARLISPGAIRGEGDRNIRKSDASVINVFVKFDTWHKM